MSPALTSVLTTVLTVLLIAYCLQGLVKFAVGFLALQS